MHLYPSLCQKRMPNSVKSLRFNVLQSYGVSGNLLYLCTDVLIMSVLILLF